MKSFVQTLILLVILFSNGFPQQFTNIAEQIGLNFIHRDSVYIPGGGVAFGDYDNDGDPDLALVKTDKVLIYENNNAMFTDVTSATGIDFTGGSKKTILFNDYDNDGNRDIFITSWYGGNKLYKNLGDGTFSDVTSIAGVGGELNWQTTTAAWGDYNRDGFIDLYIGNYGGVEGQGDQLNVLYRNNGNGTFTNVTSAAGVADSVWKKPLAISIFDFDLDGWQDIYINMDKEQRSTLFRNNGDGTFSDVSVSSGTGCRIDAMGTSIGDYNHDGWFDIYISNGPPGNILYHNNNDGLFTDVAVTTGTAINKECWGNLFIDYNNDGWPDIFTATAHGIDRCDVLLINNGDNTFSDVSDIEGIRDSAFSFGAAMADYNDDGYLDFCVTMTDSNLHFYHNNGGSNNWIKLKCVGTSSNRDAVGTVVTSYYANEMNRQIIQCGNSYLGQNDLPLIFGCGSASIVDSVEIRWTNGLMQSIYDLGVNTSYIIIEGGSITGVKDLYLPQPVKIELQQNYPNPFNPTTKIAYSVPVDGFVKLAIYNVLGEKIADLVNTNVKAGTYEVTFDATNFASGMYLYRMESSDFVSIKKMMILK